MKGQLYGTICWLSNVPCSWRKGSKQCNGFSHMQGIRSSDPCGSLFCTKLSLLLCARTELEGPSVDVQKRYSSAICARELWEIIYHVFESLRCIPGEHSEVALLSACTETFQCVIFRRDKANINKIRQIFKSLCENLKPRTAKSRSYGRTFRFGNTQMSSKFKFFLSLWPNSA